MMSLREEEEDKRWAERGEKEGTCEHVWLLSRRPRRGVKPPARRRCAMNSVFVRAFVFLVADACCCRSFLLVVVVVFLPCLQLMSRWLLATTQPRVAKNSSSCGNCCCGYYKIK